MYDQQAALSGQLITVSNLLGETVYSKPITDTKTILDLSAATDGIYFVTINSDYGKLVTKIVKE
ncbi:hypothetical protein D3C86_1821920 [compost metagenome]